MPRTPAELTLFDGDGGGSTGRSVSRSLALSGGGGGRDRAQSSATARSLSSLSHAYSLSSAARSGGDGGLGGGSVQTGTSARSSSRQTLPPLSSRPLWRSPRREDFVALAEGFGDRAIPPPALAKRLREWLGVRLSAAESGALFDHVFDGRARGVLFA